MQLLIDIVTTLLAGLLVVVVPGAALLAVTRIDRVVPPPLVPAAALALGLVPLVGATAATLALHRPIPYVAGLLGLLVLACWARLADRARRELRESGALPADAANRRLAPWAKPVADLLAGDWIRGIPRMALLVAVLGSVVALLTGYYAWNDSLYHIGQAQKLLALDAPSFDNTLQFADGSAHPGYFIPAWQEVLALVSWVAREDPMTVAWILPGLTYAIGLLAVGGLAWTLTRVRGAATVAAAAWLVLGVADLPYTDPIVNAMHPGIIAIHVLIPLVLAMVLTALWAERSPEHGDSPSPRTVQRAATFLAAVGTAGVGVLHVSYLWVLGMGLLGYYLVWALRAPWPRAVVLRHLAVGTAVLVVAGTCLALLLPGLGELEQFGRDAKSELAANELGLHEGENGVALESVIRGDAAADDYHLRNDYLVLGGGLALLGLLAVPLVLLLPRWPGGWYLAGATGIAGSIALSNRLFPSFVDVVSLDQARRIERVLPLVSGVTVFALAAGAAAVALWARGGGRRVAGVAVAAAGAAFAAWLVAVVPPLAGYAGERIVHPRVVLAVVLLVVLGVLATTAWALATRSRTAAGTGTGTTIWPEQLLGTRASAVATVIVLVASVPALGALGDVTDDSRLEKLPSSMRTAEVRLFAPRVATALRELEPGSTVLADPRSRTPYQVLALAPVYVVSSVPRHTAFTPRNRVADRFHVAVSFFDGAVGEPGALDRAQRIELLRRERVDAIVMNPRASRSVQELLASLPGVELAAKGKNQLLWRVDRRQLPDV